MEKAKKESFKLRRLALCKACPQSQYAFGVGLTCGAFLIPTEGVSCGCKLTWKCGLKNQECPQGIWGKEQKTDDEELVSETT